MGKRRKRRTHVPVNPEQQQSLTEEERIPKTMVLRKGRTTPEAGALVTELRRLMGPETAARLKERRTNRMKDFAAVAGHLGLTHILSLSQTPASLSLHIARFPRGPTLTFKVERYCLQHHVRATQKRPYESLSAYQTAPLVVLNNFGDVSSPPYVKLMKITFQNMFPPLNVNTVRLTDCRRIVLYDYEADTGVVEQRHFAIRAAPSELHKSVKRLVQTKIPRLGKMTDISEFILGPALQAYGGAGAASDSEVEDEASHVILPDRFRGRGNLKSQKSAIRLAELGPRLRLRLMKVQRGFMEGDVIYHDYIKKTPEEVRALEAKAKAERELKKRRREEQEGNVARKELKLKEAQERKIERQAARAAKREAEDRGEGPDEQGGLAEG
ncbi:Brix domain protein [Nannochloropsis gaditana]|uniref:Brix domain protein n=1 Tax=Nannochloropsis gaditana TaxID=72520 RepID=W7U3H8_9STRA|nr:Brix domain protein [Nannochloropsis gaditana]